MNTEQNARVVTEDDLLEYILKVLYNNLDKNEMHLEREILLPTQIQLTEKESEHIREILINTNLVKNSVGFGKNGFVYLTAAGIQVMKQHKTYHNFQKATNAEVHLQKVGSNQQLTPNEQQITDKNSSIYPSDHDDMAH
jgi:hypothetical protein